MTVVLLLLNTDSVDYNRVHIADAVVLLLLLLNLDVTGSSSTGCFLPRWLHHGERWTLERLANKNHQMIYVGDVVVVSSLLKTLFIDLWTRHEKKSWNSRFCFCLVGRYLELDWRHHLHPKHHSFSYKNYYCYNTNPNYKLVVAHCTLPSRRTFRSLVPFQ